MSEVFVAQRTKNFEEQISSTFWAAQTFKCPGGTITSAAFKGYRVGSIGTLTLSLRAVSGDNVPVGSDLASASFDGDTLTTSGGGEVKELTFSPSLKVLPGTKLALVIRVPNSADNSLELFARTGNLYTEGNYATSSDSGVTWGADLSSDWFFEVIGDLRSSTVGGAYIDKRYPSVEGLIAETTKQTTRPNLEEEPF